MSILDKKISYKIIQFPASLFILAVGSFFLFYETNGSMTFWSLEVPNLFTGIGFNILGVFMLYATLANIDLYSEEAAVEPSEPSENQVYLPVGEMILGMALSIFSLVLLFFSINTSIVFFIFWLGLKYFVGSIGKFVVPSERLQSKTFAILYSFSSGTMAFLLGLLLFHWLGIPLGLTVKDGLVDMILHH